MTSLLAFLVLGLLLAFTYKRRAKLQSPGVERICQRLYVPELYHRRLHGLGTGGAGAIKTAIVIFLRDGQTSRFTFA